MKKLLIGAALALPFIAMAAPASAMPRTPLEVIAGDTASVADIIEVKGGRGGGRGWGRGHGRAHGWSRGRKVGWRGRGCPPGLWKQGRC